MGYEVIAKCSISVEGKLESKVKDKIKKILSKEAFGIEINSNWIIFELSGNKGVDYKFLEKIHKLLLGKHYEISTSEYVESDEGGYYYNSQEAIKEMVIGE